MSTWCKVMNMLVNDVKLDDIQKNVSLLNHVHPIIIHCIKVGNFFE